MTQQAVLVERETECHAVSVAEGQAFVERQAGEPLQVAQVLTAEDVKGRSARWTSALPI